VVATVAGDLPEPFVDLNAAQVRIDELEARLGLRGDSHKTLPSPDAKVITPSLGDIVPPGEQGELYVGHRPGPDDHRATRRPPVIDAKPVPPQQVSGEEAKRRMAVVNADRSVEARVMGNQRRDEPWRGFTHIFE